MGAPPFLLWSAWREVSPQRQNPAVGRPFVHRGSFCSDRRFGVCRRIAIPTAGGERTFERAGSGHLAQFQSCVALTTVGGRLRRDRPAQRNSTRPSFWQRRVRSCLKAPLSRPDRSKPALLGPATAWRRPGSEPSPTRLIPRYLQSSRDHSTPDATCAAPRAVAVAHGIGRMHSAPGRQIHQGRPDLAVDHLVFGAGRRYTR